MFFSICMSSVALGFLAWPWSSACLSFNFYVTHSFCFCLNVVCLSLSFFSSALSFQSLSLPFSLSVHTCAAFHLATHFLLPIVSIKCSLLTWGESQLPLIPSLCEYLAFFYLWSSIICCCYIVHCSTRRHASKIQ